MVVEETRLGNLSNTTVRYLVSCKHYKGAVGTTDEQDVPGRVMKHHCDAFLGVYSSHPSAQLVADCHGWSTNPDKHRAFNAEIIDGSVIRKQLFELEQGQRLVKQYFPNAALAYLRQQTESNIYRKRPIFCCEKCGLNILDRLQGSVVIEATYGPAIQPSLDRERDLKNRLCISDIRIFCPEHALTSVDNLPHASMLRSLESLIDPKSFIEIVNLGVKGMYYWSPHFKDERAFIRWIRFINGLFYFVARGREPHVPLQGMRALHSEFFDVPWQL